MADTLDLITDQEEGILARQIAARVALAAAPDPAMPGECAECGDDHPRILRGRCPTCRDGKGPARRPEGGRR